MAENDLLRLVGSHVIQCSGADHDGKPVLLEGRPEQVIVKLYENGKTEPLCRYFEPDCVAPRCNPKRIKDIGIIHAEDDLGVCHYSSK